MAETENKEEVKKEAADKPKKSGGLMPWIILAAVVLVMGGVGFGLGKILGGSGAKTDPNAPAAHEAEPAKEEGKKEGGHGGGHGGGKESKKGEASGVPKNWYYDLDPVIANLNEPGATRYVRVTLTVEMSSKLGQTEGKIFLDDKKPVLTNLLTIYMASLTLEDVTGDKNLMRLQSQILESFNQLLYTDAKPMIEKILFKEFAIQ